MNLSRRMKCLAFEIYGFAARRRKRSMTLKGMNASSSSEKRPRRSPSYEEAQKEGAIVLVESSDLASNDQPALGVCLDEANIPLEGGGSDCESFKC